MIVAFRFDCMSWAYSYFISQAFTIVIHPLDCFFDIECHSAQNINPGPGLNAILLRLIPGYLYNA